MDIKKIAHASKQIAKSGASAAKKVISKVSNIDAEEVNKIQKALSDASTSAGKAKIVMDSKFASAHKMPEKAADAAEGILNNITSYTNDLKKEDAVKMVAKKAVSKYDDLTPEDAVKGAQELINAIGTPSGKSAMTSAKVFEEAGKSATELKLDQQELKEALKAKRELLAWKDAEKAKAAKEAFESSLAGKKQKIDELLAPETKSAADPAPILSPYYKGGGIGEKITDKELNIPDDLKKNVENFKKEGK